MYGTCTTQIWAKWAGCLILFAVSAVILCCVGVEMILAICSVIWVKCETSHNYFYVIKEYNTRKSSGNIGGNCRIWYCRRCIKRQAIVWTWQLSRLWTWEFATVCLILGKMWRSWCIFTRFYSLTYIRIRAIHLIIIIVIVIIINTIIIRFAIYAIICI